MDPITIYVIGFTTLAIFLIAHILHTLFRVYHSQHPTPKVPPGKTGWPMIGESPEYATRPDKFVRERMSTRSADVFQTSLMGEKMAIFCGAIANKFIYLNEGKLVGPWIPASLSQALDFGNNRWTLDEEMHNWLKIDYTKNYVGIMDSKVQSILEAHWAPFSEIKAYDLSRHMTFDLACKLFLNCHDPQEVKELADAFYIFNDGLFSVPINVPGTKFYRSWKALDVVRKILADIVRRRKNELELELELGNEDDHKSMDLLGRALLVLRERRDSLVTPEHIASKIVGLLFGGFHTTSLTVAFIIYHLAGHPHVYDKVLQEQLKIAQSKKEGEFLNWSDIQKMKYSWNVASESMRLKSPALGGFREAITDFSYKGFTIPKGWKIHWSVYSTFGDPKIFPNPEKFDPDRFEGKLPPYSFVPFGGGPRMCCGREYARIEILVFMHNFVTRFKLKKAIPNEKIIYNPNPYPVEGLRINLEPRGK